MGYFGKLARRTEYFLWAAIAKQNKNPGANHILGFFVRDRNLVLILLDAGESRIKMPADFSPCLVKASSLVHR